MVNCIASALNVVYQRTQIESKSQLFLVAENISGNWMLFIKERKLKANHNLCLRLLAKTITECCLSKNANWKQITTQIFFHTKMYVLNVVYQRTQIESKSQQYDVRSIQAIYWMLFIKERKLKANHNGYFKIFPQCWLNVVYQRTQIESKSQHSSQQYYNLPNWMLFIKERKLKANHNSIPSFAILFWTECCLSKNANWKQITT